MATHVKNKLLQITLLLTLFVHRYVHTSIIQTTNIVAEHGTWFIASPSLTKQNNPVQINYPNPMATLKNLGRKADALWVKNKNNSTIITDLQKTFEHVDKKFLIQLIDQIIHDEKLLAEVAKASYRNVTGFLKVVLAEGEDDNSWKIRLHVWELQEEKEFPHNHKWDFYSKIITGYLSQDLFIKSTSCDTTSLHSVREPVSLMPIKEDGTLPCPCRDNYMLNPKKDAENETVSLQKYATNIIGGGESYFMPNHLVHAINPGKNAISFVFTSRKKTENSEVFVPIEMTNTDLSRFAPSVSIDELKEKLCAIKQVLEQLHLDQVYLPEVVDANHHYYQVHNNDPILQSDNWRSEIAQNKRKKVTQLSEQEMSKFTLSADKNGNVLIGNKPVDTQKNYLFVLTDSALYAAPKDFFHEENSLICHTSFTDYGPVKSAGVLKFDNEGQVITIEAYSGHYKPSVKNMNVVKEYLNSIGINTESAKLIAFQERT